MDDHCAGVKRASGVMLQWDMVGGPKENKLLAVPLPRSVFVIATGLPNERALLPL